MWDDRRGLRKVSRVWWRNLKSKFLSFLSGTDQGPGARVGDLYMSLIHTCQLSNADPFDYLTELQKHDKVLAQQPQDWMPWNYRETLERSTQASLG